MFEVKIPRDFYGASLAEVEDEIRFRVARPGDHMCSSFQCPNCQCQNILGRDLVPGNASDEAFTSLVTRATLDAFWYRSSGTVNGHVTEMRFLTRYAEALGFDPFPRLGPIPLGDHLGMKEAILLVLRSHEPGKDEGKTVKYGTARKLRGFMTVLAEASVELRGDLVFSSCSKAGRLVATRAPSEGRWFQHFNSGMSARMGNEVRQDRAYTLVLLHKLLEMYEQDWEDNKFAIDLHTLSAAMFLVITCCGGMRGYEAVWTDLSALRYDVAYCESLEDYSAVSWPLVGRFKARNGVADCYMIPIAGKTNSGIEVFVWTQRFIGRLAMDGITQGWAFRKPVTGKRALAADYRDDIFTKLEYIQSTTNLIDPDCSVWDDYGVQRSGRRCFTSECQNQGVDPHDIELQCRWSTDRANGHRPVQRTMLHTYSEVRNMKKALIRPSKLGM